MKIGLEDGKPKNFVVANEEPCIGQFSDRFCQM